MYLSERVAYLKGLADGLNIDSETKEGKVIAAMIEVLGDMADEIEIISQNQDEMQIQIEDTEDELSELADAYYGDSDPDDEYDDEDWDDDEEEYAFECPNCKEHIYLDADMLDSDESVIVCPNCNEKIELEFDCDCGVDCDDCESCE